MTTNYHTSSFPDADDHADLFEAVPLHPDGTGLDDCFDLALDDSITSINARLFADSANSADLDTFLSDLRKSETSHQTKEEANRAAYAEFETAFLEPMEFDSTRFDAGRKEIEPEPFATSIHEIKTSYKPVVNTKARRRCSTGSIVSIKDDVDFDPPPAPYDHKKYQRQMRRKLAPPPRPSSQNGLDMFLDPEFNNIAPQRPLIKRRRVTLDGGTPAPNLAQLLGQVNETKLQHEETPLQYHQALRKLAESMKRTELSRRQLMMQRMGGPAPGSPASARSLSPVPSSGGGEDKSSIVAAFFSGSRGTLTDGLEQSRRHLKMYVEQVSSKACM